MEYNVIPEGVEELIKLLESKGYVLYMDLIRAITNDYIFVQRDIINNNKNLPKLQLPIIKNLSRNLEIYRHLKEDWN